MREAQRAVSRRFIGSLATLVLLGCGSEPGIGPDSTPPARIDDLAVTGSDTSYIHLTWTAPGDDYEAGQATSYDLRYSKSVINAANFDLARGFLVQAPAPARQIENCRVDGLLGWTGYYFAIKTTDESRHVSELSNVAYGTTLPDTIPPPAIVDLSVIERGVTSVSLRWTAPGDYWPGSSAAAYELRYATTPLSLATWGDSPSPEGLPVPGIAGTHESITVIGLTPHVRYYFALRARDLRGNLSPLSNIVSTTTIRSPIAWRIRPNGGGDAPSIQAGIDSCIAGDTVLVAQGLYRENLILRGRDIVLKSVRGPLLTIIDGSGQPKSVLQIRLGETRATVIEGFTFTGGVGSGLDTEEDGHLGGGITIIHSSPMIRSNIVTGNGRTDLTIWGGGIYLGGRQVYGRTNPIIENNLVENNRSYSNGAGIGGQVLGSPVIIGNIVRGNSMVHEGDGGGIWLNSAFAGTVVRGNWIENNTAEDKGGGMHLLATSGASRIEVSGNVFINNLSMGLINDPQERGWGNGGGIWISGDSYALFNNTFVQDQGSDIELGLGGEILADGRNSVIERNIIAFCRLGGGIYCYGNPPVIRNNIAWANAGGNGTGACADWVGINGNIEADPRFCDLSSGNVGLSSDSPAFTHPAGPIGAKTVPDCDLPD